MKIENHHLNGAKTVHGGAIFTLADFALAVASNSHGSLAMAINASISYLSLRKKMVPRPGSAIVFSAPGFIPGSKTLL